MKCLCGKLLHLVLSLLLFALFAYPTRAMTAAMLSDSDLIVTSRAIVTGRVVSIKSAWDDAHAMIWTYVEVSTDDVLKGQLQQGTIVLKQLGGSLGDSGMLISGQPGFAVGERVLLYLNTGPD